MNKELKPLPDTVKTQLQEERCISEDIIKTMRLGWMEGIKNGPWVGLPVLDPQGKVLFVKRRQPPGSDRKPKTMNPKGSHATLYGLPYLQQTTTRIVICEGELDVLALLSHGIEAVCSTGGAGSFKKEWLEYFPKGIQVVLCFDNDEAGQKATEKVAEIFQKHRLDVMLSHIRLPNEIGQGGDVIDFFLLCRSTETDPIKALFALEAPYVDAEEEEMTFSVARIQPPSRAMAFPEWQKTIKDNFPFLLTAAEVGLGLAGQLLIRDVTNCGAVVFIDVPAAGKTITINFFDAIKGITYSSDTFTPASFVSNAASIKKEDLSDIDLLPRIRRKIFLVRDMATIFSARDDDLLKNMGILTRVLDGEGLTTDTGIHGRRALRGDYMFMFLAGSTPIPLRVWKTMGTLGQRLFFLELNSPTKEEQVLVQQLRDLSYKKKERLCGDATKLLLHNLWNKYPEGVEWDRRGDDASLLSIIARCSLLLSRLRGQVIIYKDKWQGDDDEYQHTVPVVEKPDRINQCLYNFGRGHALTAGRSQLAREDIGLVIRLCLDSAPGHRSKLFWKLLQQNGKLKTQDVESFLGCSNPTALKELKTLCILGICDEYNGGTFEPQTCIQMKSDLQWFLSDECRSYLDSFHPVSETLRDNALNESDAVQDALPDV